MAGIIVGNAIVKGEATSGVTIAEIIGMINKYGLSLGCEPPEYISKLYQNNSASIELVGFDPSSYDEYAGVYIQVESWPVPSFLVITVDATVYRLRSPGNTTADPGGIGCSIVFSDTYSGSGPLIDGEDILAFASGTTGQSNIDGADPIATHSFVSCQYTYEIPAGEAVKVWGIAESSSPFYATLDPLSGLVDLNILRVAR